MPNYDFKQLSPNDFEQLARDLIQARDSIILESFKSGRDLGIDFRHARGKGNNIVQCKHYIGTGFTGLFAELKREAVKASKLNPTRYMLVTSVGLSPQNKLDIQKLYGDCLATADILGAADLNNLLGIHPSIEQQHYKLWLSSRAVLDRVIHNASLTQSDLDVERVYRDIRRYVRSSAYSRAFSMLDSNHVSIISGAPGVGKTSLAKMLLYAHLERGYECVSILNGFQEGRKRYQPGKKQIFYFDDFVGATFLGERATAFTRNEDREILDFIEMIQLSPTARLVMTTREHILSQAIATSEKLKHSNIIGSRCILEIGDYSRQQRAEILYNHIYFSDLPSDYREQLLIGRFYIDIVQFHKFNPRLVEWLSNYQRVRSTPLESYQTFVCDLLNNPAEIWRYAYEQQISDAARSVLLALYTYGGTCGSGTLEIGFRELHGLRARHYGFTTEPSDWRRALSELSGSFIRAGNPINVIDPSVMDLLNTVLQQDSLNALDMIEGAVRFEQARRVWSFVHAKDGLTVLNSFVIEVDRVVNAFERLLNAPRKILRDGSAAYIDDSRELRVGTLIDVAEALSSARLLQVVISAIDAIVAGWVSDSVVISDGIDLVTKISGSSLDFGKPTAEVCKDLLRVLMKEASTGCYSFELRELLVWIDPSDLDDELNDLLDKAVGTLRADYFGYELHDCKSASDFEDMEVTLEWIADRLSLNFDDLIHFARETRDEFEVNQALHEDREYDEWKEYRLEGSRDDRAIDDLFDSLRSPR